MTYESDEQDTYENEEEIRGNPYCESLVIWLAGLGPWAIFTLVMVIFLFITFYAVMTFAGTHEPPFGWNMTDCP